MQISQEPFKDWTILFLQGNFVVSTLLNLRTLLEQLEEKNQVKVALDLTHVIFIDSSAIGLIANFTKRFDKKKGKLVLLGANGDVLEILDVVGLRAKLPLFIDREDFEKSVS